MLLDLPPEVFQNILWHTDPGTLLVCLFVNKRFLELAHSKRILLHQLRSIPGLTVGIEDLSTYDAFMLFRRRATQNLCGSGVLAQVTKYAAGRRKVNVPLCVFYAGDPGCLAVTYRNQSVIRLYDFTKETIRPKVDLHAHLFQGEQPDGRVELLKVAFSEARDVAGLYAYTPHIGNGGPMVREAIATSKHILKLVLFKFLTTPTDEHTKEDTDNDVYSARQETRDILVHQDTEPLALAISNDGLACIAWSKVGHGYTTNICLYARNKDCMDVFGYDPSLKEHEIGHAYTHRDSLPLVCKIQFTMCRLSFYTLDLPVYRFHLNLAAPPQNATFIGCNTDGIITGPLGIGPAIVGIPFSYAHTRNHPLRSGDYGCLTTVVAVAVTIPTAENVAFIVEGHSEQAALTCDHEPKRFSPGWCRHWKAVARLDGFILDAYDDGRSSLGNVMAVSPQGTRIALSEWAQLRVWALSPDASKEQEQDLYFPAADICDKTGVGVLRYVELPSQGVIHSMCWHGEDRLYAMTDRGLVRWDVGPMASGRAESLSINFDSEKKPVKENRGQPLEASWEPS